MRQTKLADMLMRIIPALRYLERFIRPRWPTPFEATKRVIGGFVLLLGVCLLAPLPLSNIPMGQWSGSGAGYARI